MTFQTEIFGRIYDSFLALAYPQECLICKNSVEHSRNGIACESCWRKTRIFSGNETLCRKCGKFHNEEFTDFETFCRECENHSYDAARAAGLYESALSASILNLKKEPYISGTMRAVILDAYYRADFKAPDIIVPIPLSKKRSLERGFNQAEVIAKLLSTETGTPIGNNLLIRTKHATVHRAGMDRRGRELSVVKSFEFSGIRKMPGEDILLVDDVFASGATASACAKILKKNGATAVNVFTIARAN